MPARWCADDRARLFGLGAMTMTLRRAHAAASGRDGAALTRSLSGMASLE
jgi:hypothetical protein